MVGGIRSGSDNLGTDAGVVGQDDQIMRMVCRGRDLDVRMVCRSRHVASRSNPHMVGNGDGRAGRAQENPQLEVGAVKMVNKPIGGLFNENPE